MEDTRQKPAADSADKKRKRDAVKEALGRSAGQLLCFDHHLSHAASKGRLESALEPILHPHVLVIDELGYLSHERCARSGGNRT